MSHKVLRAIVKTCLVAVVLLLILWGRVFYGSMQDYKTGMTLLGAKQTIRAISYFDRSLHWYAPLNPYVRKSARRLWEIGDRAEREGDLKLAIVAFSTIRSGFYGSSHFVVPGKEWIHRSESRIRDLVQLEKEAKGGRGEARESEGLRLPTQAVTPPNVFWTVLLEIGFVGWIGSALGLIVAGIGRSKESRPPSVLLLSWLALAGICFALWILGMFKA